MKVAIYCRVSTDEQELEHQIASCQHFCEYRGFEIGHIYSEKFSGMKAKRPQYLQLINDLRNCVYAGVVVFRIDRLGRNSHELILLLDEFKSKGIKVYSLNENLDTDTAIGKAMVDFICILANLEREQISESTKQRLGSLKASGITLGQKPLSDFQVNKVRELDARGLSCRKIAENMQLSKSVAYNIVHRKGYYGDSRKNAQK